MTEQGGFGFRETFGSPRRASEVVRLDRRGLFWMVDAGSGFLPLCAAGESLEGAVALARVKFPASVVVEV